ncbi:hypothetical protein F0726_00989 [Acidithiobacillus caldus]|nr:hypothetical protein F0726_00989 [Acidithiobacillus caldus]
MDYRAPLPAADTDHSDNVDKVTEAMHETNAPMPTLIHAAMHRSNDPEAPNLLVALVGTAAEEGD